MTFRPATVGPVESVRALRYTEVREVLGGLGGWVVQALVTGASAGLGDTATAAVADGYGALKDTLGRRLSDRR